MARGGRYRVPFRRRRLGLTNYYKRRKMIISGKLRLIVRKTLKYIIVQIVKAKPQGDETVIGISSKILAKKYGWLGDCSNTSAAYLTGLIAGYKARLKGIEEAIPDIGLHRPVKGGKVFAVIKGAIDAGLKVPCSPEVFPSDERIQGEHVAAYAKFLLEKDPSLYEKQFSQYIKRGLRPEDIVSHFEEVKTKIISKYEKLLSSNK
ncbi:MAG: 50S ribosomal protein L18 [Thermoprotei archaeon]|nr:MAG: 50S ribosomal protein L18 [Thermoprotei archaeon]RLF01086.1 MAG: 50S ribosomal protein L18 [Thermoprotei archaeon]HDI74355.1 50S ribosomal protein L18 [Thermoprotei archaeon]